MKSRDLVIIPVFNEESTITTVIRKVNAHTKADILVIDDGSTDSSWKKIKNQKITATIRHNGNLGYGQTLISGFRYAVKNGYDIVVTMDCDEQHEPQMIPVFFSELKEADILSGSRYLSDFAVNNSPPPERKKVNRLITGTINGITGFNLTDSFCGFKAYKVNALRKLEITEPGYGMPLQVWIQAWKAGLCVREKAVARIYKDMTRSFGTTLDNSEKRIDYYIGIIKKEAGAPFDQTEDAPDMLLNSRSECLDFALKQNIPAQKR